MVKFCCPTIVSLVENVSPGQAGFDQFFEHQQSQSGTHSGMTKISLSLSHCGSERCDCDEHKRH
jgi:hypothetical protein